MKTESATETNRHQLVGGKGEIVR